MGDLKETLRDVLTLLKGIWLKKRFVMISSWLIVPIGLIVVHELPNTYKSEAVVYVDTDSLLRPILEGLAVQNDIDQQIEVMIKTLKSRPNLERIARQTDLDIAATTPEAFDAVINKLDSAIKINKTGRQQIYGISHIGETPQQSRNVVQTVLNTFVENILGENRQDTDNVRVFLDEQIAEYEQRLTIDERELAAFKQQNSEYLFVNEGGIYAEISNIRTQVQELDINVQSAQAQLDEKRALLQRIKSSTSVVDLKTRYDQDIATLQAQLSNLSLRFTDKHPEIIQIKNLIASLEQKRDQELSLLRQQMASEDENSSALSSNDALIELQQAIAEHVSDIRNLQQQKVFAEQKLSDLNSKLDIIPLIEADLTALNRDYAITRSRYEELLQRKESAVISRRADMSNSDVQFRVIDPPQLPTAPNGPNRFIFYTAVLIAGFGIGLGIAFLVSQINPMVHGPASLDTISDIPIFGCISSLDYEKINKKNNRRLIVFVASSLAVFAIYVVFIADEFGFVSLPISRFL